MVGLLVASSKVEKKKVNVGDVWFQVLPLCLRVGVLVCRCRLPSFDLALQLRNLSFIVFFSSDQIIWVFFVFYCEGHGLAKKLLLIIFIFWQISSTFPYAQKPLFHFEESLSTSNIRWLLSSMLVAIITLCVW